MKQRTMHLRPLQCFAGIYDDLYNTDNQSYVFYCSKSSKNCPVHTKVIPTSVFRI